MAFKSIKARDAYNRAYTNLQELRILESTSKYDL